MKAERNFNRNGVYEILGHDGKLYHYAICLMDCNKDVVQVPFVRGGKKFTVHRKDVGNEIVELK